MNEDCPALFRKRLAQVRDEMERYEKHASGCEICVQRNGAFCEDGDWLLTCSAKKVRALITDWNEINGLRSEVKEAAQRYDWNAQLNREGG